ncbi:MAG TPA: ABC transporter permease, partial [Candidatus Acidoferrum sp.]|nr:ABC transporter permease [Candidatus Acidoferrum sp.]
IPTWRLLMLPLFTIQGLVAALAVGLWLSALNVKYRDFRYVIPFVVQFGFFVSPVGYSRDALHQKLGDTPLGRTIYDLYPLNPMDGVINGFRWSVGGGDGAPLDLNSVFISIAVIVVTMALGLRYFRRTEKRFADII